MLALDVFTVVVVVVFSLFFHGGSLVLLLAAGGLAGGIGAEIFSGKLKAEKAGNLMAACALCVFPMGASIAFCSFEICRGFEFAVVMFSGVMSFLIAACINRFLDTERKCGVPV